MLEQAFVCTSDCETQCTTYPPWRCSSISGSTLNLVLLLSYPPPSRSTCIRRECFSRLKEIQARIAAQQAECVTIEQQQGIGQPQTNYKETGEGSSERVPWPPSVPRIKLSVLQMQEEMLRLKRRQTVREVWRKQTAAGAATRAAGAVWSNSVSLGVAGVGGTDSALPTGSKGASADAGVSADVKPVARRGRGRPRKVLKAVVNAKEERPYDVSKIALATGVEKNKEFAGPVTQLVAAAAAEGPGAMIQAPASGAAGEASCNSMDESLVKLIESKHVPASLVAERNGSTGNSVEPSHTGTRITLPAVPTNETKTLNHTETSKTFADSRCTALGRRRQKEDGDEVDEEEGVANENEEIEPLSAEGNNDRNKTENPNDECLPIASPSRNTDMQESKESISSDRHGTQRERGNDRHDYSRPTRGALSRRSCSRGSSRNSRDSQSRSQRRGQDGESRRSRADETEGRNADDDAKPRDERTARHQSRCGGSSRRSSPSRQRGHDGSESTGDRNRLNSERRQRADSRDRSTSRRRSETDEEAGRSHSPPLPLRRHSRSRSRSHSSQTRSVTSPSGPIRSRSHIDLDCSSRSSRSPRSVRSTPRRRDSRDRSAVAEMKSRDRKSGVGSSIWNRNAGVNVIQRGIQRGESHRSRSRSTRGSLHPPASINSAFHRSDSRTRTGSWERRRPSPSVRRGGGGSGRHRERDDSRDTRGDEYREQGESSVVERGRKRSARELSRSPLHTTKPRRDELERGHHRPAGDSRSRSRSQERSRSRSCSPRLEGDDSALPANERASKYPKNSVRSSPGVLSRPLSSPATTTDTKPTQSAAAAAVAAVVPVMKFSDAPPALAHPPIIAARMYISAAPVATTGGSAAGGGYGSDSSDVSDTEVAAMRSIIKRHGADWRELPDINPEDLLAEEKETIKIKALQERGELPPVEDARVNKPRDIGGIMIHQASRKLPHEVHRKILDIFQVMILEPYYYPEPTQVKTFAC